MLVAVVRCMAVYVIRSCVRCNSSVCVPRRKEVQMVGWVRCTHEYKGKRCKSGALYRSELRVYLCSHHYMLKMASLRPSQYVRVRPLPKGCFDELASEVAAKVA